MKIVKINKISLGHRLSLKDIHRDSTDISISDLKDFRFFCYGLIQHIYFLSNFCTA